MKIIKIQNRTIGVVEKMENLLRISVPIKMLLPINRQATRKEVLRERSLILKRYEDAQSKMKEISSKETSIDLRKRF